MGERRIVPKKYLEEGNCSFSVSVGKVFKVRHLLDACHEHFGVDGVEKRIVNAVSVAALDGGFDRFAGHQRFTNKCFETLNGGALCMMMMMM